jgi:dihydrofolate reductase
VHAAPAGDAFFPPIDPALWREVSREEHAAGPHDSAGFAVAAYLRR